LGYTFDGWFTARDGGSKITADTVVTADVTYYAHWTETPGPTPPGPTPQPPGQDSALKTFFGLNKDCTILTKDNKILRYSASSKTITLVGDYSPTEYLAVAKNVE